MPERSASPVVAEPNGGAKANVLVRFVKGHVSVTSGGPDELFHTLALERDGRRTNVDLDRFTHGYLGETPDKDWTAAVGASFDITFAPDGHALAVSADGGKTRTFVILDAGDPPFVCGKRSSSTEIAPTRALVLAGIAAAPLTDGPSGCDLAGLIRYACGRKTDAELWGALAGAFVRDGGHLVDTPRYAILDCLQDVASHEPSIRKTLADGLPKPASAGHLAEALAKVDDADVQSKLAAALRSIEIPAAGLDSETCWARGKFAWALASVTVRRKAASDEARTALTDLVRAPDACPSELVGKFARVYGVAGLAALGEDGAKQLADVASTCAGDAPGWTLPFAHWNEASDLPVSSRSLECFAKGALAR